jgi:hypothetical protein
VCVGETFISYVVHKIVYGYFSEHSVVLFGLLNPECSLDPYLKIICDHFKLIL